MNTTAEQIRSDDEKFIDSIPPQISISMTKHWNIDFGKGGVPKTFLPPPRTYKNVILV